MWLRERISVLETLHPEFRQRTVDNLKGCLAVTDIAERDVPFFGRLIDQDRVALAERPSLRILAGLAHRYRFAQQRPKRERLRRRPIDPFTGFDHLPLCTQLADDL